MRILAVDIGTGTQDILLFDSSSVAENCIKMVLPSPTAIMAQRISVATAAGRPVLFVGVTMGGGPIKRALARHANAGLPAFAAADAALTFHDDLEVVKGMGVKIVDDPGRSFVAGAEVIELKDLDLVAIRNALRAFGVDCEFDAVAVAVLDHGLAPPGVSNRIFRFDYLQKLMMQEKRLSAFAHLAGELPPHLTRMKAVAGTVDIDGPVLLMDTGAAAALGALQDSAVSGLDRVVTLNVGNSHAVAFHLHRGWIEGLFEHHTNLLDAPKLDGLIEKLLEGSLTREEVYADGGHGAVVSNGTSGQPVVVVTGPRQKMMAGSRLEVHSSSPHGDTMMAGCYGLVAACAMRVGKWRGEIEKALGIHLSPSD